MYTHTRETRCYKLNTKHTITYARRLCLQYLNSLYLAAEMVLKKGFLDDLSQSTGFAVDQVFENFNTFFLRKLQ